jgi:amino acid adenylation domain-containing protein
MADILDVYELTPLQAGMLFHTLYTPGSGTYFQQSWCLLEGPLDVAAFRAAWQSVIARHEVLRSECHWEELDRPVQVIYDRAEPDWHIADWSGLDAGAQDEALEDWLAADRRRGFQLDKAPLLRFALLRLGPDRHRFVWSFHHLLMDGWCGSLLVREVLRVYAGVTLPPEPPPYRRYVEWRAAQDAAAAEAYWRQTLAGIEGPTPLGLDRPTAAEGTLELRQTLRSSLSGGLAGMARASRLTLNTLMQGAWALLLARYSGQDDVLFGAVQSGRPPELPGVETMVGLFLNTVPVRVNTDPGQPLVPWLQALQTGQRQRERFGHTALTDIHRWSGLPAGAALFDSLLIVENYPLSMESAVTDGGGSLALREGHSYERTHYPLTLKVFPGDKVGLSLSVDLARIDPEASRRLLAHFRVLLEAFTAQPDARLGQIELLDDAERDRMLALGRGSYAAPAGPVHEQIFARAAAKPDATAVEFEGVAGEMRLTYAELAAEAQAVAAHLRDRGVGPGTVVGVCLDRGPDLVAALLGVLCAGAAYLPLDPDYPAERIAYVLGDAGARLVLTDARGAAILATIPGVEAIPVSDCLSAAGDTASQPIAVAAEDLAYILYTSGSTGRPKGVPINHGSLSNFLQSMAARPGLSAENRLLAVTTVAFDIAALELFGPLSQGGTLILADAATARDGLKLADMLERKRATVMQATPAGWRLLVEAGWKGGPGLKMLCGGEALDSQLAAALLTRGGELWNLYGPTETTIWSAALRVEPSLLDGATVPVGGALDRTQLYVVDQRGSPVPIGIPGELMIGGAGLSPGYWGRPDLTAEKFIPDALCGMPEDGGMLYHTGDRVRWSEDGMLEFLGRLDGQIKLRGHRIELGEIEARLTSHPAVAQAVVIVSDDGAGPRLVAYLRWRDGAAAEAASVLRDHLAAALPAYMLPSVYVALTEFPLTPNGKIDRRALQTRSAQRQELPGHKEPTPIFGEPAATLADIWRETLRVERVGPQDNFFDLGGHSLLVVTVQSAIRQKLRVPLEMVDIFRFPTLETLAGHVAALSRGKGAAEAVSSDRAEARAQGQQRLLQRRQRRA